MITLDEAYRQNPNIGRDKLSRLTGISERKCRTWLDRKRKEEAGIIAGTDELEEESVRLAKSKQKLTDSNRVVRKILRENYRVVNTLEELTEKFITLLKEKSFTNVTIQHNETKDNQVTAVVQLSDLHFNELIDLSNNKYDFSIASIRLKLFATRIKQYLKPIGVTHLLLACSSDFLNSDRRLDEIQSQSTNRTQATFLAVDILQQFIRDLNEEFNVTIMHVVGNESRVRDELTWSKSAVSDSYDTTIFEMLRYLFIKSNGITFLHGDPLECVVKVGCLNFLIMHGHGSIKHGAIERSVAQIKGRYASNGTIIDMIIFGHMHSAHIGDLFARSSSLCGANAYSEKSLNLSSRASQNIYIVYSNGLRDAVKIDLQVIEGEGYPFDITLASYNPKSESKTVEHKTTFRIVI